MFENLKSSQKDYLVKLLFLLIATDESTGTTDTAGSIFV